MSMNENHTIKRFEDDYKTTSLINDQNTRYTTAATDSAFDGEGLREFQELALKGISAEQQETFDDLSQRNYDIYEEIALADLQSSESILKAQNQLEQEPDYDRELSERIYKAARRAIELSPRSKEATAELVTSKVEHLPANPKKSELVNYIVQQELLREEIAGIYEVAGRAWPLPMALLPVEAEPKPTTQTIDIIPDDPPQGTEHDTLVSRTREKYGYNVDASQLITLLLMENAGKSKTALDIGLEVYTSDDLVQIVKDGKNLHAYIRGRIHRRFTPANTCIPELLANEGYSLQYGHRIVIDQFNKQIGHMQRIYRAVKNTEGLTLPQSYVQTMSETGDELDVEANAPSANVESKGLSEQEERMLIIEAIIETLSEFSIIRRGETEARTQALKARLLPLCKDDSKRFNRDGEFAFLKNYIISQPRGLRVYTRDIISTAIGDRFGSNLPKEERQSVMLQVDAALKNFSNDEQEVA